MLRSDRQFVIPHDNAQTEIGLSGYLSKSSSQLPSEGAIGGAPRSPERWYDLEAWACAEGYETVYGPGKSIGTRLAATGFAIARERTEACSTGQGT